jgi:hypothetical protein
MADLPHPANTKPASRQWFYILSGLLATVLPTLSAAGVLPPEAGVGGGVVGGAGALTAGAVVSKQRRDGLHDEVDPIDQIQAAIPEVLAQAAQANANVDKLREVTGDLLGNGVDVLSAVSPQAGSLADQVLNQIIPR